MYAPDHKIFGYSTIPLLCDYYCDNSEITTATIIGKSVLLLVENEIYLSSEEEVGNIYFNKFDLLRIDAN